MAYGFILIMCAVGVLLFMLGAKKSFNLTAEKHNIIACSVAFLLDAVLSGIMYGKYIEPLEKPYADVLFIIFVPLVAAISLMSIYVFIKQRVSGDKTQLFLVKTRTKAFISISSVAVLSMVLFVFFTSMRIVDTVSVNYSDWAKENELRKAIGTLGTYRTRAAADIIRRENSMGNTDVIEHYSAVVDLGYPLCSLSVPVAERIAASSAEDNTCNIVVMGDSFVWGYGFADRNNVFWQQLSNELEGRGYDVNVVGVGISGASTFDELQWLRNSTLTKDLQPDIIIIGYINNDPSVYGMSNINSQENTSQLSELRTLISGIYPNIGYVIESRAVNGAGSVSWCKSLLSTENLEIYDNYAVKPLAEWSEKTELPVVVVTLPTRPDRSYYEQFYEPVEKLFGEYEIPFYNSLDAFCDEFAAGKHSKNYTVNPVDAHPGTASSYFYAQYIADFLEKDYSDILKKQTSEPEYTIHINDWLPYCLNVRNMLSTKTLCEASFTYPSADTEYAFFNLPLEEDYVVLSFEHPVDISSVSLEGEALLSADIYYQCINPKLGYDDMSLAEMGTVDRNTKRITDDAAAYVTSLCIHAQTVDSRQAELKLTVECEEGSVVLWQP